MGARVELLGKVAVLASGGRTVHDPGRQGRRVLAMLAIERHRPVSRDELAEVVWEGAPPPSWAPALRTIISRVRRTLAAAGLDPQATLLTEHDGYQLVLPADATVDLEEAAAAHGQAQAALSQGDHRSARDLAETAAAMAEKPLLPEVSSEWADECRREARALQVQALEVAGDAALASGDPAGSVAHADTLVALDPYLESAHRLRMRAHAEAGNVAAALRAYEDCRRALIEDIGVGPSPATEAVYEALLAGPTTPNAARPPDRRTADQRAATTAALPRELRLGPDPLVGRAPDMALLDGAWRAAEGEVQMVLVAGEPGIGKTRLAAELAAAVAREGATVLYGRCQQDAVVPYHPFVEVVRQYAMTCTADRLAVEAGVGAAELCRLLPELGDQLGIDPPQGGVAVAERHQLLDAVAVLLTRAAVTSPVLVVIDDLHWADAATLVLLQHLLRRPDPASLLLVGTYRDTDLGAAPELTRTLADLDRAPNAHHLQVSGLAAEHVADLIAAQIRRRPDEASASVIHHGTGGNPFFVEAVVRHLLERDGADVVGDSTGPLVPTGAFGPGDLGAPHSVRRLIDQRLAPLPEPVRLVLTAAAVIGRSFDAGLLAEAADLPVVEALDAVDSAVRAGILTGASEVAQEFAFVHDLMRHAIYDLATHGRRARLHARVAAALERRGGRRSMATLAHLAHHYARSGSDLVMVATYSREAGEQAMAQFAYEDAATHFRRAIDALAWAPEADRERAAVLVGLGDALPRIGDSAGADATLLEAVDAARRAGDGNLLGRAVALLAELRYSASRSDPELIGLLQEAVAMVGATEPAQRALLLSKLHQAVMWDDAWLERSGPLAEEAVDLARRSGDPRALSAALSRRWAELWSPGDVHERLEVAEEIVALAEACADPKERILAAGFRIMALLTLGDFDRADRDFDANRLEAERLGLKRYLTYAHGARSLQAVSRGDLEGAERFAIDAFAAAQAIRSPDAMQTFGMQLLAVRREQGRVGELREPMASLAAGHPDSPIWNAGLAFIAAESDESETAAAILDRVGPVRRDQGWLMAMALLAEVTLVVGDLAKAEQLYAELAPHDHAMVILGYCAHVFGAVADLNAGLAALLGRYDDAIAHHENALSITAARPRSPSHVRSLYRFGSTLAATGGAGTDRAIALLETARATAASTGMSRLSALATDRLRAIGQAPG